MTVKNEQIDRGKENKNVFKCHLTPIGSYFIVIPLLYYLSFRGR